MTSPELTSTPPQLDRAGVLALGAENPHWFPSSSQRLSCEVALSCEELGRGESFTAWLLRAAADSENADDSEEADGAEVVVRVPRRPVAELSQAMDAEFAALARAPQGLTAQPVDMHSPTPHDPRAYLVTTRVPGVVRATADWRAADFDRLAEQLARLHVHAAGQSGIHAVAYTPVADAEAAYDWWCSHEPEAAATISPLMPGLVRHQQEAAGLSPQAESCFIHGDVSLSNILLDSSGCPRLVDWEWSGQGDPAKDLAYSGGPVHLEPFYAPMSPAQIRAQAQAYTRERETLGVPVDLEELLARRCGYLMHEVLFTSAHFWRVAQAGGEEAELYARRSELMRHRVIQHLSGGADLHRAEPSRDSPITP